MKRKRILFLFISVGLLILNYPFISQMINRNGESRVVRGYQDDINRMDAAGLKEMMEAAEQYNQALSTGQSGVTDAFSAGGTDSEYENLLNLYHDGVMGYISIPKIEVMLPIYHGVSVDVLEKGVGHLYGSSMPVGGEGTHAVLSSHRGLPSKTLFTDLDQLEIGDHFYITVLSETLAYEVDDIRTVTPDNAESLGIVAGKDYVTLVTCTPYGINSHRLLVRGTRVPYIQEETEERKAETSYGLWFWMKLFFILSVVVLVVTGIILLIPGNKQKSGTKNGKDGKK